LPPLPDRRVIEGMMARMLVPGAVDDALSRAQDLIYDAFDAPTTQRRIALAQKALEISPLCADAYVLIAEHAAPDFDERLGLYRRAVDAGERALGRAAFEEDVGHFWGLLETRPYMRARLGLAQMLWASGRREEAVAHYRDLLRLNPNDNQGVRYLLAACYLELGDDDDLAALLRAYEEDGSAPWAYAAALPAFRRDGDGDRSRKLLAEALDSNQHVPGYLLGERRMPKTLPGLMTMGGEDEAVGYVADYHLAWARTPGALDWLVSGRERHGSSRPSRRRRASSQG
jgi:tetratricopeptide (TPR) repeat protein